MMWIYLTVITCAVNDLGVVLPSHSTSQWVDGGPGSDQMVLRSLGWMISISLAVPSISTASSTDDSQSMSSGSVGAALNSDDGIAPG